ncbi:hypothetical protein [Nostoc sp.]|uniref:hypothetical protein n=1 Tax=Nostoc sp. TaxID=1180 RepID=UPI002FFB8C36
MSNINNQTQDLYSIELVQDLDHEAAATVSGGVPGLVLTTDADGEGSRRTFTGDNPSLGTFDNETSWFSLDEGNKDWFVYTGENFRGRRGFVKAGTSANFNSTFNDNIESAKPV